MAPLVSVLMPAFNAGRFMREAVESVLDQSCQDFELVIVDDGSTDNSMQMLQGCNDPRVRVIRHASNRGVAAARNSCLEAASGEFFAWLDADDRCHPSRLREQLKVFTQNPGVGLCGTWVRTFGADKEQKWQYPIDPDTLKSRMLFDDPFATSSVMLRRSVLETQNAMFNESFLLAEDYDCWERLSHVTSLANIAKYLTYYRLHEKQTSKPLSKRQNAAVWKIQERQLACLAIHPSQEERTTHLRLGVGWSFAGGEAWLARARSWLERLSDANREKGVYPEPAFAAVLADRWYRVCRESVKAGISGWRIFRASRLADSYDGSVLSKVRLALGTKPAA